MNEHWWNSFHSRLACASDGNNIVGPEKGWLSEARCAWWMTSKVDAAAGQPVLALADFLARQLGAGEPVGCQASWC